MSILNLLWPIHRSEIKKIIPMLAMLFLLSFNQSALWNLKDTLIVTTSGAAAIPFLKVWAIIPSVLLLTAIYTFLSNRFKQETIFYTLTGSFLALYSLFAFVIYPHQELFQPVVTESALPEGLVSLYTNWTFTVFYIVCEMWNTVIISMLFWGFANAITLSSEGGRFYSVLSVAYNGAVIAAGAVSIFIAQQSWEGTLQHLMLVIVSCGILSLGIFRWMHKKGYQQTYQPQKKKLSLMECVKEVGKSKYLICMAVVVVSFGVVFNVVEVLFKEQLRLLYPSKSDYNHFINVMQVVQGGIALILSLGMAGLIRRLGWTKLALITPIVLLALSLLFFPALMFGALGAVIIGSILVVLSKGLKYSLFDTTKEMAYLPLSDEAKLKGKTAIDGLGLRLGKSGGAILQQSFILIFGTLSASAPYVGAVILVILFGWIVSTRTLGRIFPEPQNPSLS